MNEYTEKYNSIVATYKKINSTFDEYIKNNISELNSKTLIEFSSKYNKCLKDMREVRTSIADNFKDIDVTKPLFNFLFTNITSSILFLQFKVNDVSIKINELETYTRIETLNTKYIETMEKYDNLDEKYLGKVIVIMTVLISLLGLILGNINIFSQLPASIATNLTSDNIIKLVAIPTSILTISILILISIVSYFFAGKDVRKMLNIIFIVIIFPIYMLFLGMTADYLINDKYLWGGISILVFLFILILVFIYKFIKVLLDKN